MDWRWPAIILVVAGDYTGESIFRVMLMYLLSHAYETLQASYDVWE